LKYGVTTVAVQRLCKKYGIKNPRKRTPQESDTLRVERIKRLLKFHPPSRVAKIIGILETSLYRVMRKEGLKYEQKEPANRKRKAADSNEQLADKEQLSP
jgi:transposase